MADVWWLDDDKRKLKIVPDLLRNLGVRFRFAHSFREACESIKGDVSGSLLLLDAILPPVLLEDAKRGDATEGLEENGVDEEEVPFEDLEAGGRRFQEWCEEQGIIFSKTIIISYVPERRLEELGYKYDGYINKLELPDRLDYIEASVMELGCDTDLE